MDGEGNHIDFGARGLDTRIGRWWSADKIKKATQAPYVFGRDNPIIFIDPDGADDYYYDSETKAITVIRTGKPHRYFTFENSTFTSGSAVVPFRQINKDEVNEMLYNNTSLFVDALKNASSGEEAQEIFNSRITTITGKFVENGGWALVGLPAGMAAAEVFGSLLIEEGIDYAVEKTTGVPVIISPVDVVETVAKKEGKALIVLALVNKNRLDAKGKFVLYEIEDKGKILKVGKGDAEDIMPSNKRVRRVHVSERKARKIYPDAEGKVVEELGEMTTGEAIEREAKRVRNKRRAGHELPLNKEKDKRYQKDYPND